MDANKLQALQKAGFEIRPGCGLCEHGKFQNDDWGTCSSIGYEHLKHTGGTRQASVHKLGYCPMFKPSAAKCSTIHGFLPLATWEKK